MQPTSQRLTAIRYTLANFRVRGKSKTGRPLDRTSRAARRPIGLFPACAVRLVPMELRRLVEGISSGPGDSREHGREHRVSVFGCPSARRLLVASLIYYGNRCAGLARVPRKGRENKRQCKHNNYNMLQ